MRDAYLTKLKYTRLSIHCFIRTSEELLVLSRTKLNSFLNIKTQCCSVGCKFLKTRSFFDIPIPQVMRITISMKKESSKEFQRLRSLLTWRSWKGHQDQCIASGPLRMGNHERDVPRTPLLACHKAHKRMLHLHTFSS